MNCKNSSAPSSEAYHDVFVYGTLLTGLSNHHWLDGAQLLGAAVTQDVYSMVDLGTYPAVLETACSAATHIVGEVWRVNDAGLAHLDVLEDYPSLYRRGPVRLQDGTTALIYTLRGHPEAHGMHGTIVSGGDYRRWLARTV